MQAAERSESGLDDVLEGGWFWSMVSVVVGTGSQEEHMERAEVRSEMISLALSESKDAAGRISSLPWLFLNFWEMLPWK